MNARIEVHHYADGRVNQSDSKLFSGGADTIERVRAACAAISSESDGTGIAPQLLVRLLEVADGAERVEFETWRGGGQLNELCRRLTALEF